MAKQTQSFQTEVQEILNLMIHSLYSHKEIFLRELISNASDALDKLRFASKTEPHLITGDQEFEIRLEVDDKNKVLKIIDNGIGMSFDEVVSHIGTIARSGTKEFIKKHKDIKDNPDLIGQFGVGFYSAFMVSDRIQLHTQKAGSTEGVLWESEGQGSYSIDRVPRPEGTGTTITLHLKQSSLSEKGIESKTEDDLSKLDHSGESDSGDSTEQDFTQEWVIKGLVKKYSDFISYPIKMKVVRQEPKKDKDQKIIPNEYETIVEDQTLNSRKALWLKNASEIKPEEYEEFYKHITHDWSAPLKVVHYRAEGLLEFHSLFFIPENVPWNYHYRDTKWGMDLYVKRVFIKGQADELLPRYLRFVKGVVESDDVSLNVSRELLQQDRQVTQIRKNITNKILSSLKEMKNQEKEKYTKFWAHFGATVKEGLLDDSGQSEKLKDLVLFKSTKGEDWRSLEEYVSSMPEEQKDIYYLVGESLEALRQSPYLEALKMKNFEVLLMVDPVDEWAMQHLSEYKGKSMKSVAKENLDLTQNENDKKAQEEEQNSLKERFAPLIESLKAQLKDQVKDVRVSSRLTDSAVCLVSGEYEPTAYMQKILSQMGKDAPHGKRVLEINPKHPLMESILSALGSFSPDQQKTWAEVLLGQALLTEGSTLPDPVKFSKHMNELFLNGQSIKFREP